MSAAPAWATSLKEKEKRALNDRSLVICCICNDRKPEKDFSKSQLRKQPDERAPDVNRTPLNNIQGALQDARGEGQLALLASLPTCEPGACAANAYSGTIGYTCWVEPLWVANWLVQVPMNRSTPCDS